MYKLTAICLAILLATAATAQSFTINGPAGSGSFGNVTVLTNGNFVVSDPLYDEGATPDVGAVYLYNGITHALISTLKGSTTGDLSGSSIILLSNGNFLVLSPQWDNVGAINAGAVTWCNSTSGTRVVSSTISLVGSTAGDLSGSSIFTLNENYIVRSVNWDNGGIANAGAVTWGNGTTGITGAISIANSLVGSTANDNIGNSFPIILSNGNYVLKSPNWDNGGVTNAGAVTWCNGTTGRIGAVSSANSLVGSTTDDFSGNSIVTLGSNYIVVLPLWDNVGAANAGAVTWCNGGTGRSGVISSATSLVGSTANNEVGVNGITRLSNGNYLVASSRWDNGGATDAGAVTWGNGSTGITGIVSSANSLVGSKIDDFVGISTIALLSNGNYIVPSINWDNGLARNAGAVTWGNGTSGTSGAVSIANSLVGSATEDIVGFTIAVLNNGNYVVASSSWNNGGVTDAGAVTWCDGTTGRSGVITSANSLVGSTISDNVGLLVFILNNGNYVVKSRNWDNGGIINVGAATWGNGTSGTSGVVSSANSLVGTTANDRVGDDITALSNGNYVVQSPNWDNVGAINAGAVTWCNGTTGTTGQVTSANSLVGSTSNDNVGVVIPIDNGNYVVISSAWNNVGVADAGAVTWCNGTSGTSGVVNSTNSLVGSSFLDQIGNGGILSIGNGNYVVLSSGWDNVGAIEAGAVTWFNGSTGISGVVSSANSLVGSSAFDQVGGEFIPGVPSVTVVSNGNYVVGTPTWDNVGATDAGAVTWCNGTTGTSGVVSSTNSLVGTKANDQVGGGVNSVIALSNGNYVVRSLNWDNGALTDVGAATWCNGSTGTTGAVSSTNSLVGSTANDQVGNGGFMFTGNGNYLVLSFSWDNGVVVDAGAVTWGNGSTGVSGSINSCNSVTGSVSGSIIPTYNGTYDYLIAALPTENKVVIYNPTSQALANHLDIVTSIINGNTTAPLVTNPSCRIIGTITPNGANPVSGLVNAKAWIESSVPSFAGQPFVARHYEITPATDPSTATGRVTLYFTQQEFTDFNNHSGSILNLPTGTADAIGKSNLRIGKYAGTTNNATGLPGSYTNGAAIIDPVDADIVFNNTLSRWEVSFNVTGFSGFIVQTFANVLPLTLLEFNGRLVNNNGLLNWKTTDEQNTSSFDIERSTDGRNYTAVGNVAAFNTSGIHLYNYTDNNIIALGVPVVYYRLKQKDIDGRVTYSRIVALSIDNKRNIVLLYPNPAINEVNITITINKAEKIQGRIIDNAGRAVKQLQWNVTAGSSSLSVDVSSLAKGMYYLELKGETVNIRKQFVKQ